MKNLIFSLLLLIPMAGQAQNWWKSGISGEGPVVKRQLDLDAFERVVLSTNAKVYLRPGTRQMVEVEAQENIIDNLVTEVSDRTWRIRFDRSVRRYEGMKVYITLPTLTGVRVSGSGNITGEGTFRGMEELSVGISGSGDITLDVEANTIDSHISGSGGIRLSGTAKVHDISISGSGDVSAYDLRSGVSKVRISGSGDCEVDVQDDLEVRISGSGDVNYKGRPRVNSRISGSGDIRGRS